VKSAEMLAGTPSSSRGDPDCRLRFDGIFLHNRPRLGCFSVGRSSKSMICTECSKNDRSLCISATVRDGQEYTAEEPPPRPEDHGNDGIPRAQDPLGEPFKGLLLPRPHGLAVPSHSHHLPREAHAEPGGGPGVKSAEAACPETDAGSEVGVEEEGVGYGAEDAVDVDGIGKGWCEETLYQCKRNVWVDV
jgi:hypothetical protein